MLQLWPSDMPNLRNRCCPRVSSELRRSSAHSIQKPQLTKTRLELCPGSGMTEQPQIMAKANILHAVGPSHEPGLVQKKMGMLRKWKNVIMNTGLLHQADLRMSYVLRSATRQGTAPHCTGLAKAADTGLAKPERVEDLWFGNFRKLSLEGLEPAAFPATALHLAHDCCAESNSHCAPLSPPRLHSHCFPIKRKA